ncbi:MAG: Uma2 family endonuclease [Actinobacteria bacterium]|nr:Uma2 family endonuclease [Actinomycetota bacterium]
MATPEATGLTVADLEAMPEDMVIRHLIDGELFVVPPPTIRHQRVVTEIAWRLRSYEEEHGGTALTAPTGVRLSDRDMPEPDVLFVKGEHRDRLGERYVEGPPDLVVEVSSPSTRRLDLVRKRRQYERFGIPEYWFVDLDADRVEVYVLEGASYTGPVVAERGHTVRSTVLTGFFAGVDELVRL